jgi:hypothetical protein
MGPDDGGAADPEARGDLPLTDPILAKLLLLRHELTGKSLAVHVVLRDTSATVVHEAEAELRNRVPLACRRQGLLEGFT